MNKPIIIGAGISGLSCANYLSDNNITNILIEAGTIGQPKICGEFFSPEAIPILKKWNIDLIPFQTGNFFTPNYKFIFNFPKPCASFDRSKSELQLSKRAMEHGTKVIENVNVANIIPAQNIDDIHQVILSNGTTLETDTLVIATGKLPFLNKSKLKTPNIKYTGIKAHFKNINIPNQLNMYLIPGAYMGLTNINNSTVNVCCLAKYELFQNCESPEKLIELFLKYHPNLKELIKARQIENEWLIGKVPNFGKKKIPYWPNTYFIGDAAATIFPATGNGLSMGLTSAVMAANKIINNSKSDFRIEWNVRYKQRLQYAKLLNYFFMNPDLASLGFKLSNYLPFIPKLFYKLTRD